MDRRDIKTGIVGLGNIGQYHAERLLDLGVPLVGGMDVAADARRRFANRYDADAYEDHDELYDEADAIVVTTPNRYHERYAVEAFERDLHVLLEKPLAHTPDSAKRIVEAARESNAYGMVGFNNRFANTVKIIREHVADGDLGTVTHVEANYVRRRGIPGRGSWFTSQGIAGGGALIDLGVHAIDLALYLLSYPAVEDVVGVTRSHFGAREDYAYLEMWANDAGPAGFDVDDSASAFIRCGGDRSVSLEVAWATNRPTSHEFVVHGTESAATFDLLEGDLRFYSASTTGTDHLTDTTIDARENDTHRAELEAFFDRVVRNEGTDDSVEQALTVQRVIDAIYRSSEDGQPVSLTE